MLSLPEKEPSEPYVEEVSETERLIAEMKQLETKNECLQEKKNILLEGNKLIKFQRGFLSKTCAKIRNNFVVVLV